VRDIRQLGVGLAIDDFGVGYSSLSSLNRLDVDSLKLDRSFVIPLDDPEERAAQEPLIRTIVELARSRGLKLVAEGVETAEQRAALLELGCTHAQGFLFSRPVTAAELEAQLGGLRVHQPA